MRHAAQHGLSDRVCFTGPMTTIEQAYHAADLFVMPSTREAFGMVLVEAMASALPVIATAITGVTDEMVVDGRTGVLVPAGDVDAMAAAIRALLVDSAHAREMGALARDTVAAQFGLATARERWAEVYDSVD